MPIQLFNERYFITIWEPIKSGFRNRKTFFHKQHVKNIELTSSKSDKILLINEWYISDYDMIDKDEDSVEQREGKINS